MAVGDRAAAIVVPVGEERDHVRLQRACEAVLDAGAAVRDGDESTFELHVPALAELLRTAGALPARANRTLRLRRIKSTTVKRSFFHLVADLSDGTTTEALSLKKACRSALSSTP